MLEIAYLQGLSQYVEVLLVAASLSGSSRIVEDNLLTL